MDAKLLLQSHRLSALQPCNIPRCNRKLLDRGRRIRVYSKPSVPRPAKSNWDDPVIYRDTLLDRLAIDHWSHVIQDLAGIKVREEGYPGFVEACRTVYQTLDPIQLRKFSIKSIYMAFPPEIIYLIKVTAAQMSLPREMVATAGSLCCGWLVGPSEVRESQVGGKSEKNVIYVKKCRFLESSNCVGMCINQCKLPTQTFIKDVLGMPLNMVPNFEDMSCELRFGEEPPAPDDDPALKQPCYKLCKISKRHTQSCSTP